MLGAEIHVDVLRVCLDDIPGNKYMDYLQGKALSLHLPLVTEGCDCTLESFDSLK